jgi:hypothetical protein
MHSRDLCFSLSQNDQLHSRSLSLCGISLSPNLGSIALQNSLWFLTLSQTDQLHSRSYLSLCSNWDGLEQSNNFLVFNHALNPLVWWKPGSWPAECCCSLDSGKNSFWVCKRHRHRQTDRQTEASLLSVHQ